MSARCKPGDLAIVVRTNTTPEMLGRVVIVDRADTGREGRFIGGLSWNAPEIRSDFWVVRPAAGRHLPVRSSGGRLFEVPERPYPDFALRPIRLDEEVESLPSAIAKYDVETAPAAAEVPA